MAKELNLRASLNFKDIKKEIESRLISNKDIAFSLKQLYGLLSSGINLYTALDVMSDLQDLEILKNTYQEIRSDLEKGKPIYIAFNKRPLPVMLSNMLFASETSENLENVFKTVSDFLENIENYKSKIISKAMYPSVVIIFSIVAMFVAVNYVIPRIKDVLNSFGAKLPIITILLVYFVKVIIILLYLSPVLIFLFFIKERFIPKQKLDKFYTKIPFFGKILMYFELSKFLYAMSLMLSSNSSMGISIRVSTESVNNNFIKSKLSNLEQDIYNGMSFYQAMAKTNLFKKSILSVIRNGEYAGDLGFSLKTSYQIYQQLLDKNISTFVSSLEPIATMIVGVLVSLIVLSVILPIVDISASVH